MRLRNIICTFGLLLPATVTAGDYHVPGTLQCGDCHLQHGTDPQNPAFAGPFTYLLKKNSVNELCLSCHDGTDAAAPDVQDPVVMYNSTSAQESGAGFIVPAGLDNPNGHALGLPMTTPLQGASSLSELNCTSCHAPHGNGNYRNLNQDPAGTGVTISVIEGVQVFTQIKPDIPPSSNTSVIAYSRDNIGYARGLSTWCVACHDQLSANNTAALPAHFNTHPSDIPLNEFGISAHTDGAHWTSGAGEGFAAGGGLAGGPRVPFQVPNADDFISAREAKSTNEVSCVSCHKAHGSSYRKGLIWPYLEGGDAYLSGCQQCHNK